jgi:hypothetical protein
MGRTPPEEAQRRLEPQDGWPPGPLFLAAIAGWLGRRVLGARAGALGTVMTNRGATVGGAAGAAAA